MRGAVEAGQLFRKSGTRRVWRVERMLDAPGRAHVQLRAVDDPTTVITVAVAVLGDRSLFQRIEAPREDWAGRRSQGLNFATQRE